MKLKERLEDLWNNHGVFHPSRVNVWKEGLPKRKRIEHDFYVLDNEEYFHRLNGKLLNCKTRLKLKRTRK